jgi:hypothetical protein
MKQTSHAKQFRKQVLSTDNLSLSRAQMFQIYLVIKLFNVNPQLWDLMSNLESYIMER